MNKDLLSKLSYATAIVALLTAVFATTTIPINSYDFWWHLKTGQYISDSKTIPETDPFTYTATADDPSRPGLPRFILTQNWLYEVIYAKTNGFFGLKGIIALRGLLYSLIALSIIVLASQTRRASFITLILFLLSTTIALEDSDRPQTFSYLSAILVVAIMEYSIRSGKKWILFLNAPLMLLASNMHGGYVVGFLFMIIYSTCAFFEKRLSPFKKHILISSLPAFFAAYINPNHWRSFFEILYQGKAALYLQQILEYRSPLSVLPVSLSNPGWLSYWLLVLLSVPTVIHHIIKGRWSTGVIHLGTLTASLFAMRFAYFFIAFGAFSSALYLDAFVRRIKPRPLFEGAAFITLIALTVLITGNPNKLKIKHEIQPMLFPVNAAGFIMSNDLPKPVFNDINWGGYLEHRLWPKYKMFTDTRNLFEQLLYDYHEVVGYTAKGKKLIELYEIATIIVPAINPYTGQILPLVEGLYDDPGWALAYSDGQALIFIKKGRFEKEIPKHYVYYEVLSEIRYWRPLFPWISEYEVSEQRALKMLGLR